MEKIICTCTKNHNYNFYTLETENFLKQSFLFIYGFSYQLKEYYTVLFPEVKYPFNLDMELQHHQCAALIQNRITMELSSWRTKISSTTHKSNITVKNC